MRNLILIFLLFAASTAVAQSNQPFFAARAIMPDAPGDLGSDMYRVVLEISDQTGVYDGLDVRDDSTFFLITQPIAVGDDINLYPVLAIGPAYANIITVDVLDIDEAGPPNMGSQVLCEQSPDGLFAYVSGAGDPLNQAISDYNMKRVELELASRIDSLEEGLNVTFSGSGTNEDPLVINASGGGAGTDDQTAAEVSYDNSTSGLAATEVQTAIDLLENEIDAVSSGASDGVATGGTLDVANEEIDVVVASPGSNFSIDLDLLPTISGFAAWDKNTADDFDGAWSSLTGIPAGFADGVDARLTSGAVDLVNDQLFFSGFGAGFTVPLNTLDQLNVFNAWDKNAADDFDGAWSSLTGIPAGFADGVDNVGSGPTDEEVEDLVGPMFTTSTGHTRGFSFTYDDINSQIDLDHVGEHLQLLNFTPTYYTRVTDGIDFPFAVDLGSHLNGIDLMFEEVIPDAAFVSTTSTIDAGNESSHFQVVDMTGVSSKSLTFSNIPNGGAVILLFINADDTDTINWPSTVKWETGAGVATDFLSTGRRMIQLIHDGTDYWVPGGY